MPLIFHALYLANSICVICYFFGIPHFSFVYFMLFYFYEGFPPFLCRVGDGVGVFFESLEGVWGVLGLETVRCQYLFMVNLLNYIQ